MLPIRRKTRGRRWVETVWDEQRIRWLHDASVYTGYDRRLAALLLAHIPRRTSLCDVGCGAGLVDAELAPYFREVTCVDRSAEAVAATDALLRARGVRGVTTLCADARSLSGRWDTVLALFHGGAEALRYLPLARDRLVLAVRTERRGSFGPPERKRVKDFAASDAEELLRRRGVRYTRTDCALEHGQPLRSYRDAEAFVRAYSEPLPRCELDAYLRASLRETGRSDFPFYLPKEKKFALFIVYAQNIPRFGAETEALP